MLSSIKALFDKLCCDTRGAALAEFALALPILLLFFAATVDITRMVLMHQKVDRATFTVADLTTQLEMDAGVCSAGNLGKWNTEVVSDMLKPFNYTGGDFNLIVSAVLRSTMPNGSGGIRNRIEWRSWLKDKNDSILGNYGSPYSSIVNDAKGWAFAGNTLPVNERIIVAEMTYYFRPIVPKQLFGGVDTHKFRKVYYMRGRSISQDAPNAGNLGNC